MRPLDELVNEYIDELDLSNDAYARAYRLGIRCLRTLHSDLTGSPVSVELEVLPNKTAIVPEDLMSVRKVGIINDKGQFVAFRRNDQLSNFDSDCTDRLGIPTRHTTADMSNTEPWGFYRSWPGFFEGSLGVGSDKEYGSYTYDEDNGLILFDFKQPSYPLVILEYIPMLTCDGSYPVHPFCEETVIAFIKWKMSSSNRNISASEKREYKKEYYNELRLSRGRLKRVNLSQIYTEWRRQNRSAPKI